MTNHIFFHHRLASLWLPLAAFPGTLGSVSSLEPMMADEVPKMELSASGCLGRFARWNKALRVRKIPCLFDPSPANEELSDILEIKDPKNFSEHLATFAKNNPFWLKSSIARQFVIDYMEKAVSTEMKNKLNQLLAILPAEIQKEYLNALARETTRKKKDVTIPSGWGEVETTDDWDERRRRRLKEARTEFDKIVGCRDYVKFARNNAFWLRSADAQKLAARYAGENTPDSLRRLFLLRAIVPQICRLGKSRSF